MASARIRTLEFLPEIFQTPTNAQFLGATLDQLVNPPITQKIEGYIGSKIGYGINAKDQYVKEIDKTRTDYQLDPGVVFTKPDASTAQDFISYPGILDAIKLEGGIVNNNNRLFESEFYSWDSFTNLDKLINFNQYYWIPNGPPSVTVAADVVYATNDYLVTDLANGYNIRTVGAAGGGINPTLTLLRGGIYRFFVNQTSQFWIQTEPSVSGYSPTQTNLYVREVFGVANNGAEQGIVEFVVPQKDAQNEYNFPGNNLVDVVSTLPYSQVNGQRLVDLVDIDGVTSLDGLTVMFYNTGDLNEQGYTQEFFDENFYDVNGNLVLPKSITVTNTNISGAITCDSTANLVEGQTLTFDGVSFGGLNAYASTGIIYYVKTIIDSTQFTVSTQLNGSIVPLVTATGTLIGNINQGLYEEGFYDLVKNFFYKVEYVGNPDNPVLKLVPFQLIPTLEKITVQYGTEWINRNFYKNILGTISLMPYITAPLDILYYQDGSSANKVGMIRLIESNFTNTLNVETDILGKTNFTSTNGIVFTNGLKVSFDGDVIPTSYLQGEYYVEGVGTAIELIPTTDLFCPEPFTEEEYISYDSLPYDIGNYDGNLYIPILQDYITIARNSINKNAWSRSNRWFHIDVINATANYNNDPNIAILLASKENKAKRPIIEFYPNLALFNSGTEGKAAVDFIDFRTTDAFSNVQGQVSYYPDVETYTSYNATLNAVIAGTSTNATIANNKITGVFQVGQYITDTRLCTPDVTYPTILPTDARITNILSTNTTTTLTIGWAEPITIPTTVTNICFVANDQQNDVYKVFDGARIIFASDTNPDIKNKIYLVNISQTETDLLPVITLTEEPDALCLPNDMTVIIRGYTYLGKTVYFDGINWIKTAQQKIYVNQPPLFDVFDKNNISFGNADVYQGTTFEGCKLFAYGLLDGGLDDPILAFPIRYSNIDNIGDISFDVSINLDTFKYVDGTDPKTEKVNTGYVFNYVDRENYYRQIGWQTAIGPSVQYQVFNFDYFVETPPTNYTCDVSMIPFNGTWPTIQVYINNVFQPADNYTVTVTPDSTIVKLNTIINVNTIIQILVLSKQVSEKAYYQVPINLSNNPFNSDLMVADLGDIRQQYQSIFYNNLNSIGQVFGPNNYRDLGNVVPYGNKIIQNSASLVLPGTFLRKQNHNLFDALLFNSREYIKFKALLVNTVSSSNLPQQFNPSAVLDEALDIISTSKNETQAFFWSDMLPNKSPYIQNTYTFNNTLSTSRFPLSRVYNFDTANYYGLLVYLARVVSGSIVTKQLIKGVDYNVDANTVIVTLPLQPADKIIVKEYNQTYGSYVPNTPTKLGLYPAFIPSIVLDSNYFVPTYFIKGHDGSYTKLYGEYNETLGTLIDFRDQALLEFETRIYNNLKLSSTVPIASYEVLPGYFRDSDYSNQEFLQIYSESFLNWVGENRLNYQKQFYNSFNEFTYNYTDSQNKLNKQPIEQGYWRGIYQYLYDTTTPQSTPWEMLGFANEPTWWEDRYGPAPYSRDNLVLWQDLENGIVYNNGSPYIIEEEKRPGLLDIIPTDSQGNLLSPFAVIVGNYNSNIFEHSWKVGDDAPVELSYRRSSTWPFDLMRILALTKPAKFFNLGVDLDNYRYNSEFNQYLVNDRSHLVIDNIQIYGNGIAKTSYINWIVDYEKQLGLDATDNITSLLYNLDVRLVYRLGGFSDKDLLKFYVEKSSANSNNSSLLIPDESYSVLLYENQPYNLIVYSAVVIQLVEGRFVVYGNSQFYTNFRVLEPITDGYFEYLEVEKAQVKVAKNYSDNELVIPYGYVFESLPEVAQFLASYGEYLTRNGMIFDEVEFGFVINWTLMIQEFLYWAQIGWESGAVITLNPSANVLKFDKENRIVQPLTLTQSNFLLNQNLYPIKLNDLNVLRDETLFVAQPLNQGDTISYGQFKTSNIEHGIVFNNVTEFNDRIYNLTTGLRQNRMYLRGTKTAEWNGSVNAYGFILNQDNITEWTKDVKYTKGQIVKYKNKYWTALSIVQPSLTFNEELWKITDYDQIQKGLLPNSSTRSYESTLYYNCNEANLEQDADLLSFSLIGYRPRDYLALVDLTDITQINVYKNLIKNKGTKNAIQAFRGADLPQGGIDYEVYENWAIKSGQFGGTLNENFVEFRLSQSKLTGNPSTVCLTDGKFTGKVEQQVQIYNLFNYQRPIDNPDILPTIPTSTPVNTYQDAGYVNFYDVKMSTYFYRDLKTAVDVNNTVVPLQKFYVRNYAYIANYLQNWQVFTLTNGGIVIQVTQTTTARATVTFLEPHNLEKFQPFVIINFNPNINGYYYVVDIINLNEVSINLTFNNPASPVVGYGIALVMESQRVADVSEINDNINLLSAEFVKNTVWVDESKNGGWAVYRKSINYKYETEFYQPLSVSYGSAVAYTNKFKYLFADAGAGKVYRYDKNPLTKQFDQATQVLTGAESFGSVMVYADNLLFVSEPTSANPKVYIFVYNDSILTDEFINYQTPIQSPIPNLTSWGTSIAVSTDTNWLYISDTVNNQVVVYRKQNIELPATLIEPGITYIIKEVGDTDWESLGALTGQVGITFISTGVGEGTGVVVQCMYQYSTVINPPTQLLSNSNFGHAIATNYSGDTVIISAPNINYSSNISNWGETYVYQRGIQNFESQVSVPVNSQQIFELAYSIPNVTVTVTDTNSVGNLLTCLDASILQVNAPIIFNGTFGLSGLTPNIVYYVDQIINVTDFTIKLSRTSTTTVNVNTDTGLSITGTCQVVPLTVTNNGVVVADNYYAIINNNQLYYNGSLTAGDIINVSTNNFTFVQTLTSNSTSTIGIQFGSSVDVNNQGTEILVGAPFELSGDNQEGAVYRYTYSSASYGMIMGTQPCNVTSEKTLLLNGYMVQLQPGNAASVADTINALQITNINSSATSDNKLIIDIVNKDIALINKKLIIGVTDTSTLSELGLQLFSNTQIIRCPHVIGPTQFGSTIKFNEFNSVIISAPTGTRYTGTQFDFVDDENLDKDTVFDNNSTQFIDLGPASGAVYMFDYLQTYNENLDNPGSYVYAQSTNNLNLEYGKSPKYGHALDFNENRVIIGTPTFLPDDKDGQVVLYINSTGAQDWEIYRESAPIVDINRVNNIQLFSATTNDTLINLDYFDPLQGKLLGAVRQNIDFVSNTDPAVYSNATLGQLPVGLTWGASQVGRIWFNTNNVRFVNYHQDNVEYNARYWGTVFPGSDVAVYTWTASNVIPSVYVSEGRPGTPLNIQFYTTENSINAAGQIVQTYYFWVRNSNIVYKKIGKTLSDTTLESYIKNPKNSGISYFAPIYPDAYALYNVGTYLNANDTVLHIGYSTGTTDDVAQNEFTLIRSDYADDFLPGLPANRNIPGLFATDITPESLYDRLLDSMSGTDETGQVVPNPWLPKAVQSGVLARPRQSFFYNRLNGIKNYLLYANEVLKQYPIAEIRREASFLFAKNPVIIEPVVAGNCQAGSVYTIDIVGEVDWTLIGASSNETGIVFTATGPATGQYRNTGTALFQAFNVGELYNTENYWEFINWWAEGYNNNTKSILQVPLYADLSALNVATNSIVTVAENGDGKFEVYRYDGNNLWTRIGLQNGTIQFKLYLWDYAAGKLGFGDNFFDTSVFDLYPSQETRYIVRALNEQIYINELLIHRNKSLILLFEYIQSETIESQNFIPWLNKTSLVDVAHTIRELRPVEVFQSDNQKFLEGYINEAKPYHVLIKEFIFKYTGEEINVVEPTDFDLPATYDSVAQKFVSPQLSYLQTSDYEYLPDNSIWLTSNYNQWFINKGVSIDGGHELQITTLASYITTKSLFLFVENANGFPINGIIRIGKELIVYSFVDTSLNLLGGLYRGYKNTPISNHIPGEAVFVDLPSVIVLYGGRAYVEPPKIIAYVNPENTKTAEFTGYIEGSTLTITNVIVGNIIVGNYIFNQNITYGTQIVSRNTDGTYEVSIPQNLAIQNFIQYLGPTREAQLQAVMNLDQVSSIEVIDPGQGYMSTPEIRVAPSLVIVFTSNDVLPESSTVKLYAPNLQTGDLVQYEQGASGTNIGGLVNRQWYYINLLQTNPITIVGFYTSYSDAVNNFNRVQIYSDGTGNDHQLKLTAKATAIVTASPIRENNVKLRYDRTTYNSQVIEWEAGQYYGSFFAGSYSNSEEVSSSSIQLQSTQPSIDTILASAQGVAFEIETVNNDRQLVWSTFIRTINSTIETGNIIRLTVADTTIDENSSGSTIGFYVGMPIKFQGTIPSPILVDTIYYVHSVVNETDFTISSTQFGAQLTGFNNITPLSPGATATTAQIIDTAVLTVNYPGILTVTNSTSVVNKLTVPVSKIGTGGTNGFYIGLPVFFTEGGFGNIVENYTYYVVTVIDNQNFTVSDNKVWSKPITENSYVITATETDSLTNIVTVDSTDVLNLNDPIIFSGQTFGGIVAGALYYVAEVVSITELKISNLINGSIVSLSDDTGSCLLVSQVTTTTLTTATGNMIMNVALPVSPGQVDGQLFTLYQTSQQYPDIGYGIIGDLINRDLKSTLYSDKISITTGLLGTDNFYVNMPVRFVTPPAGSGLLSGVTYYVKEFTGLEDPLNPGTYFPGLQTIVTNTDSSYNNLNCNSTNDLYLNMPIIFSGQSLGGVVLNTEYFVRYFVTEAGYFVVGATYTIEQTGTTDFTLIGAVDNNPGTSFIATGIGTGSGTAYGEHPMLNGTQFKLSASLNGSILLLEDSNGSMTGTGNDYLTVGATKISPVVVTLSYEKADFTLAQFPSSSESPPDPPIFDISYILGGYRAIISYAGNGFAIGNTIEILGASLGGVTPLNNLTMIVNNVDEDGAITELICNGTPPGVTSNYYLKVISSNQFEVYSDPLMQVPVSGIGFDYVGFTTTVITGTGSSNTIIVEDTGIFEVNDAVVFTGNAIPSELIIGQTYYILTIPSSTTVTVSLYPQDSVIAIASGQTVNAVMSKAGSFALLPEPFYFNQSIVKFNNRVYVCIISNNDNEFIFGKWELLDSGDRRLNALDRVIGYYKPEESNTLAWNNYINMPGVDLSQLFTGVTNPNINYLGNPFEPGQQFTLDTVLKGDQFYPNDINLTSIIHNDTNYVAVANAPTYSLVLGSVSGETWSMAKLSNVPIGLTDLIYNDLGGTDGVLYVATSTNSATPIIKSANGINWSTEAYLAPDLTPLNSVAFYLNSIIYHNSKWIAVGKNIITSEKSSKAFVWTKRYSFETTLYNELFDVAYCQLTVGTAITFDGYIAVGKAQNNLGDTLSLILTSVNGISWTQTSSFTQYGLLSICTNNQLAVVVGENGIIYYTDNSNNWVGINHADVISVNADTNVLVTSPLANLQVDDEVRFTESFDVLVANTSYFIHTVVSQSQVKLKDSLGNLITLSGAGAIPNQTLMYKYPQLPNLNKVIFENSIFMAVGNDGIVLTSNDAITWTEQDSDTTENLNNIVYVTDTNTWTVVGDNNTIIKSTDDGVTWENASTLTIAPNVYEIEGAPFSYGYGPEELVPGNITDNLQMIVTTRPGTNWPVTTYAHTGYNVVSYEVQPTTSIQTVYNWAGSVLIPAQLSVFVTNGTTGLSTRLYNDIDFSINWINRTITLFDPIAFSPVPDTLRIDVYEVGNGDQLVKSNTEIDPIRTNTITGFSEIYLNCNYSDILTNGSGVIRPGTSAFEVVATETVELSNSIICEDVSNLVVNSEIKFQGSTFGNIVEDTPYFIKSISIYDNSIIVSASITSGIAGPTFELIDATGIMALVVNAGTGQVWSDPYVALNGTRLVLGKTNNIVRTKSGTNTITTNSTGGITVNSPIVFSNTMFGNVIVPQTIYYVKSIVDINEFTISTTLGGATLTLTDATGGATFITNDFAFAEISNSTQAKIIFAENYNNNTDYIVYSVFGETEPQQYGYTILETEVFDGDGSQSVFNLTNYNDITNVLNAIVEVNGIRQTYASYEISLINDTITFTNPPPVDSTVAISTYNVTERQYLNTDFGITSPLGLEFVTIEIESTNHNEVPYDGTLIEAGSFVNGVTYSIAYINDDADPPGADTDFGAIGAVSINAGSLVDGETYIIYIVGTTDFTLAGSPSNTVGTKFTANFVGADPTSGTGAVYELEFTATGVGSGTGSAILEGYGYDSTIVEVGHLIIGKTYIIKTLGTTTQTEWNIIAGTSAVVYNVGDSFVCAFSGLGYGDGTAYGPGYFDENLNWLTCAPGYTTTALNIGDPIVFSAPTLDGIAPGVTYYIIEIWNLLDFVISTQIGGEALELTDDTGSMIGTINGVTVANIINIDNSITAPLATTYATATIATIGIIAGSFVVGKSYVIATIGTTDFTLIGATSNTVGLSFTATGIGSGNGTADLYELEVDSTSGFVIGQTIQFRGTSIGGVETDGTVYFVCGFTTGAAPVYVTICDENNDIITVTPAIGNMYTIVGGNPTVRVTTGIPHNLLPNSQVRIDGCSGSVQLNGKTFYVHVISSIQVDLYTSPFTSAIGGANYPVTEVNAYTGNGYIWLDQTFVINATEVFGTDATTNKINIMSYDNLIINTPVIFTQIDVAAGDDIFTSSNIIAGATYYVTELTSDLIDAGDFIIGRAYTIESVGSTNFISIGAVSNTIGVKFVATGTGSGNGKARAYYIKISEERFGTELVLTTTTADTFKAAKLSQWEQYNVDRLWVTIDGYRVPSSKLKLYDNNNLGILTTIQSGQEVIITSMVPSSTPDQEIYMLNVNQSQEASVYRANTLTKTWLTEPLFELDEFIYVDDVSKITNSITQNAITPALNVASGTYKIGLEGDKNIFCEIKVYNNNPSRLGYLNPNSYKIIIEDLSPVLVIYDGLYIQTGDNITITIVEGKLIVINGEQILFGTVNSTNNSLGNIQRGANNTGIQPYIPVYTTVYSKLSSNMLSEIDYNKTWNSEVYNTVEGDPLQISVTESAEFLHTDIT